MLISENTRSLYRCLGFFSYYSKWIPKFSDRTLTVIRPWTVNECFPLNEASVRAFQNLKQAIEDAVVVAVDENEQFEVETDESEWTSVLFRFSRMLQGSEINHPSTEKEAQAIIAGFPQSLLKVMKNPWKIFFSGKSWKFWK